jgi:methionyl-tRNA formyltransferase
MLMDPGLDTGPILLQWVTEIGPEETAVELAERLSVAGADLMVETLRGLEAGKITPQTQDNSRASRAPLLKKEHGQIDWNLSAQQIANRIRGFLPWPGCYTGFRGKKLQIWRARIAPDPSRPALRDEQAVNVTDERPGIPPSPGQLVVHGDSLHVACGGNTILEILEVQLEGRRRMTAAEFLHGSRPQTGESFHAEKS